MALGAPPGTDANGPSGISSDRSSLMSRIGPRDTKPELLLRRAMWHRGLRYRVNYSVGRVRPDVVFVRDRVAVFVDGCFWHGCPDHYVRPRARTTFWAKKLRDNVARDQRQTKELERDGWQVLRVWEHETHISVDLLVERVARALTPDRICEGPSRRWQVVGVQPLPGEGEAERRVLEELRGLEEPRVEERQRTTTKW